MVPLPFLTPSGIAVAVATSGNRHTLSGGSRHLESNTASPGATSSITKIRSTCTASTKVALLPVSAAMASTAKRPPGDVARYPAN